MPKPKIRRINGHDYLVKTWWEKINGKWKKRYTHLGPVRKGNTGNFVGLGLQLLLSKHARGRAIDLNKLVAYPGHQDLFDKYYSRLSAQEQDRYRERLQTAYHTTPNFEVAEHRARQGFQDAVDQHRQDEAVIEELIDVLRGFTPEEVHAAFFGEQPDQASPAPEAAFEAVTETPASPQPAFEDAPALPDVEPEFSDLQSDQTSNEAPESETATPDASAPEAAEGFL